MTESQKNQVFRQALDLYNSVAACVGPYGDQPMEQTSSFLRRHNLDFWEDFLPEVDQL